MKITFHIGAHRTDDDGLMRSLMRNNQKLATEGIYIPGPSRFRDVLRDVAQRLKGQPANNETVDMVLDTILDTTEADHIVLSDSSFLCGSPAIFSEGSYYGQAGERCRWLRNIFPGHEVRFALGIRNPATQLPAVYSKVNGIWFEKWMNGVDPRTLRWSDTIGRMVEANPGSPLIVWANEDTPLIWPEVIRQVSGHSDELKLKGGLDIASQIMESEGMKRLRAYMTDHPPKSEPQRRKVLAAFLDKYAKPDEIEEVIDVPGWTADLVEEMTEDYEDDLGRIPAIPGVSFIEP